ncbi:MAG: FAD-binding oxidoreductase [bacterium]
MNADTTTPELSDEPSVLARYQSDFGNLHQRRPATVARPRTVESLRRCFAEARARGLRIALRGGGQSFSGHSLCADGMVVDMTALVGEYPTEIGDGWVRVAAGGNLSELRETLRQRGLRVPVYTSAPSATVGGTLAAGGVSGRSYRRGMLAQHVRELELMGTDGRIWRCSRARNADLFSVALGSIGLAGALLSVTLATEPLLPFRARLLIGAMPLDALLPLRHELDAHDDIASLDATVQWDDAGDARAEVSCAIEAASAQQAQEMMARWREILRRLDHTTEGFLGAYARRGLSVAHIDDPVQYSMSRRGWRFDAAHASQLAQVNRPDTFYKAPLSVAFAPDDGLAFARELRRYAAARAAFFPDPAVCFWLDAMARQPNPWLRLSRAHSHVLAFEIFACFRHRQVGEAMKILSDLARLAIRFRGRMYPYSALADADLTRRLLPPVDREMRRILAKTDPDGQLGPAWVHGAR